MRIRLAFIGCRLNISEIESLSRQFKQLGHYIVGAGESADLCIFNSCAVTHIAARTSRQNIRRLKRTNPYAKIVVTGCYAELSPQEVAALEVDLVLGNDKKEQLIEHLIEHNLLFDDDTISRHDDSLPSSNTRTRAFVKVQDGCDNRCTFCIVTMLRGVGRSRPIPDIVSEIQSLVGMGYKEVVLTGVHLGSFGNIRQGLKNLVMAILKDTDLPRLRLSSLEPWDLTPDFFELWQNPRLGCHLHLPLQSGCEATLKRMARRTTQAEYSNLLEIARQAIPHVSITTDLIVGFPGETDAEFEESYAFVDKMAFSDTHIFRFSPREGTVAYKMKGHVPHHIVKKRSEVLHELSAKHAKNFRKSLIGQTSYVLWEQHEETPNGKVWSGLSDNYVRVYVFSDLNLRNHITNIRLTHLLPDALGGILNGHETTLS
ncbi:MAG: tRNA (N(6)-L-threonylcarbamoyladenosine(37)-C(2))-methylthiotransferase MtaB [Anaerolineaceae bacterium 4572_78]|nr:MAG: tRNA (N(6)-L-threonylcarbamoyladenosine(37)-C(2))-methylthiotransferase MtaB [Anaerolineaceae bacterium 4572_78]